MATCARSVGSDPLPSPFRSLARHTVRTRTAAVTGGAGNSNALVGTPETVAHAILDYCELGVDIISMRGYDLLADAIDIGQQVIPIVREGVPSETRRGR